MASTASNAVAAPVRPFCFKLHPEEQYGRGHPDQGHLQGDVVRTRRPIGQAEQEEACNHQANQDVDGEADPVERQVNCVS